MNFLEKDLETIIWENYERCESRGLVINQPFYSVGKPYRQLNLAPYGIADLVYLRFSGPENIYYVQVIELKKGKVDAAAYMQAKRYQTALIGALKQLRNDYGLDYKIVVESVIIGNEVELAGDFVFCLNTDFSCSAYTYSYGFDGIEFKNVGKEWGIKNASESPQLQGLMPELYEHRCEIADGYQDYLLSQEAGVEEEIQQYGDYSKALLVTPEGILLNRSLFTPSETEPESMKGEEDGAN